jgi:hypothetical protein
MSGAGTAAGARRAQPAVLAGLGPGDRVGVQHATGRQAHLAMKPDTGLATAFAW